MDRNAERDLPILMSYLRRLIKLMYAATENKIEVLHEDHFGFMCACFMAKQLEHAISVELLVKHGQFSDATTITRLMLEGAGYLVWASMQKEQRAKRWRVFSLVSDWKLLQEKKQKAEAIDPDIESELKERLAELGAPYLKKSAKGKPFDDENSPFRSRWLTDDTGTPLPIKQVFEEIDDPLLNDLYEDFSQWTHWTPLGFGRGLKRVEGGLELDFGEVSVAAQALAAAIQAGAYVTQLFSAHFELECGNQVRALLDQYKLDMGIDEPSDADMS